MPLHVRALLVIAFLSVIMLWLARPLACAHAIQPQDYRRRALVWFALTLLSFLSQNYWVFVALSIPLLMIASSKDSNPLGFYLFLIFAVPPFRVQIPGMGILEHIIAVDHTRWMAIAVLLPACLRLRKMPDTVPFGRTAVDRFIVAYLLLLLALQFNGATFTNLMRIGFNMTIDTVLPYYVASRALRDLRGFRDALMSFVVAVLLMAPMAVFEFSRYWLLYSGLETAMGLPAWGMGNYLARGEALLRASVSTGHPIVLGYVIAVALALSAYLRPSIPSQRFWLVPLALSGGLVATVSRGPWVGAAAALLLLLMTGPAVGSKIVRAMLLGMVALPVVLMTKQGQKMLDYLPFIGTVEAQTVEFRQRLFEVSLGVIAQNPFFGSFKGSQTGLEELRGSDGIIDVVNTYVLVALNSGVVGLVLFAAPFVIVSVGIARALHAMRDKTSELHLLGRALLAALIAIAITIATTSPICTVPVVYMAIIGLGTRFLRMEVRGSGAGAPAPRTSRLRRPSPAPG
jgi:O-antigen ligase